MGIQEFAIKNRVYYIHTFLMYVGALVVHLRAHHYISIMFIVKWPYSFLLAALMTVFAPLQTRPRVFCVENIIPFWLSNISFFFCAQRSSIVVVTNWLVKERDERKTLVNWIASRHETDKRLPFFMTLLHNAHTNHFFPTFKQNWCKMNAFLLKAVLCIIVLLFVVYYWWIVCLFAVSQLTVMCIYGMTII